MPTSEPAPTTTAPPEDHQYEHRITVLMFTDLVNSTGLKVKIGDLAYATRIALPHNALFRSILGRFPGTREINYTGDGFLASFDSAADAVQAALLFHHALRKQPWGGASVQTRVGVHLGESIILEDSAATGLTIASHAADICSRLMSLGLGGQTLLTRHAFDDARQFVRAHPELPEGGDAPDLVWEAHGPYLFKGKDEPLEVFEVGAAGIAPLTPPPDAEKARRAIRPGEEETLGWRPAQGVEIPGRPDWRLVRRLGEGGFGEVWLAEHDKLKQHRVFKFCFDEVRLRSFKRELTFFRLIRDALGERSDIAQLFDVKLDAPPFFLESEFAEHGNLVEWCAGAGGAETVPLSRRLEILACVAEAAAAAHSIGILHKDIKPQNVLMQNGAGGATIPQLADFGIGALADRALLAEHDITAAGFTMNTLAGRTGSGSGSSMTRLYAPPEQLSGKPFTVQGDVFALGVMLYQFVVGDFNRAMAAGWERDVADELLRADIAACVDGDPARRLASAAELATRLRTIEQRRAEAKHAREQARLSEELAAAQIRAKAERERLRRTRWLAGVIGLLALAAIVAGFSAHREQRKALQAEAEAQAEKRQADVQRENAVAARRQAEAGEAAADAARQKELSSRKAAEELIRYMQYDLHDRLMKIGQLSVMDAVNTRVRKYREDHPPEEGDLEGWRERTVAMTQNADVLYAQGELTKALAVLQETLVIRQRLVAATPDQLQAQRDLWSVNIKIADVLRVQGKLEAALQTYQTCLSLIEGRRGADLQNIEEQNELGMTYQRLGDVYRDLRRNDEALDTYRRSHTIRAEGTKRVAQSKQWPRELALVSVKLGDLLRESGKYDEALPLLREGLALRDRLLQQDPGNDSLRSDICLNHELIGDVFFDQGKFDEALTSYRENLRIRERLVTQDQANAGWARELAFGFGKVGNVAVRQKDWVAAATAYQRELELARPRQALANAEVLWIRAFSNAAGHLWEVLKNAPPGSVTIAPDAVKTDLQTSLAALTRLRQSGNLVPPMDKDLPWIEAMLQSGGQ